MKRLQNSLHSKNGNMVISTMLLFKTKEGSCTVQGQPEGRVLSVCDETDR